MAEVIVGGIREGVVAFVPVFGHMGHMGHRRGAHQPTRGAPPKEGGRIGVGGGGAPLFPPPPSGKRKGGGRLGLGAQVGFLLLGVPQGCRSPPLTYKYVGRGHLEHTPTIVSRVRCPPPQFMPPVIFS